MLPFRRALLTLAGSAAAWPAAVWAQAQHYAVLSLLADKFDVVNARAAIGSRIDQNRRQTFEDPQGLFDRYAAVAVERAIRGGDASTAVTMLALPRTSVYYDQPHKIFDGRSVALPGSLVDALIAAKASRLVLLTKHRDEVRIPLTSGTTGTGNVRGLGFYIDSDLRLIDNTTGESSFGVLCPFVYVRLSLIDVESGDVLREQIVRAMSSYLPSQKTGISHPWDVLGPEQKIEALRGLLERELAKAVPALLG
jgi:hypothetical protein